MDYTYTKKLTSKAHFDVIVCGGGVAGCAAAYSAAKRGMKTVLFEKSTILGGLGTLGLINLFVPMCNGRGRQVIFGLCEKWTRLSSAMIPSPRNGATASRRNPLPFAILSAFLTLSSRSSLCKNLTRQGCK